jgi:hypothetical protein
LALYLFLVTVADGQGLSYYSDQTIGRLLPLALDGPALARAPKTAKVGRSLATYPRCPYNLLQTGDVLLMNKSAEHENRVDFQRIWIDQSEAAKGIEAEFGTQKALDYLIGEKFINFLDAAESSAEWRRRASGTSPPPACRPGTEILCRHASRR